MSIEIFDKLVDARAPNSQPEWFAELLDKLLWILDFEIYNAADAYREWLERCDDKFKVQVVLAGTNVFPFEGDKLKQVLDNVAQKWPDLSDQCEDLWHRYEKQIGSKRS